MGDRGKHEKAAQSERRSAGHGYAPVPGEIGPASARGEQARGERQLLPLDQPPGQDGPAWSDLSIEHRRPYLDVIARTSLSGPELAAANWAVLDPVERQAWIHERPAVVGNTDGIAAADRDAANRIALPEAIRDMKVQLRELEASKPRLGHSGRRAWREQVTARTRMLAGYQAVEHVLNNDGGQPLLLMALASDGNGRAVIAINNPDTAADVVTFVPGTGAKLTGIGADLERSGHLIDAAKDAGSASTSVITWYGYDAPQSVVPAASKASARAAAPALGLFQDGLRAAHASPRPHHTLIGHSYGTTVIGAAASEGGRGINADDVILVASPGALAPAAARMKIAGVPDGEQGRHVYATTARLDPIRAVPPVHGRQPVRSQFGGTQFRSAPGGWNLIKNHSAYWRPHSDALENMGLIISGHGSEVSR